MIIILVSVVLLVTIKPKEEVAAPKEIPTLTRLLVYNATPPDPDELEVIIVEEEEPIEPLPGEVQETLIPIEWPE